MFTAYFDASGHSEDQNCPFVAVAGFIGNLNQWKMVEEAWVAKLRDHRIYWPFHMTDFMARGKDFKNWDGDAKEHEQVLYDLTVIEHIFPVATIGCVINLAEYRELDAVFELRERMPPFALGARTCMDGLRGWANYHQISGKIECIFEDGDFGRGKFIELMRQDGLPAPIFKDKQDFAALQAADHLAWELFFRMREESQGGAMTPLRLPLIFQRWLPHITVTFPKLKLIELCHKLNVPTRRIIRAV